MTSSTRPHLCLSRRAFALAAWAALLAPGGLGILSPSAARADHDDDSSGRGGGDDDDDGGRGRGRVRGGDDDDDGGGGDDSDGADDPGDDRSGPGGGDGSDGGEGDGGQAGGGGGDRSGGTPRDIAVFYPDGWVERILGGRYELIDDQSRLVVRRAATGEDFARMEALR